MAPFPGPGRMWSVSFSLNGKGYVGGGQHVDDGNVTWESAVFLDDFYEYDPETDTWLQLTNIPGGKSCWFSFQFRYFGYVGLGGNNDGVKSDFWKFDLAQATG